jgi:type I restriction enzyme S subunit
MIEGLKPHKQYRESGLPWLGRYPITWKLRRMKVLFQERVQKGFPHEPLLAATQTKGVVRKEDYETRTVTAQKDLHLLKLVEKGDYVISLRSFQGGIEVAHCRGIISPAYTILEPRKGMSTGYYSYFFKSKQFIDSLSLFVTGIREGQNIDYERLSRSELPFPPEDEQAAIVRFLNHANRNFEHFIRGKRKLIALLNEQKQAIIQNAVTRGLNPDVKLKPSGIPWLGGIPANWEVMQMRQVLSFGPKNGVSPRASNHRGVLSFSISAVRDGRINITGNEKFVELDPARVAGFSIQKGDILLVRGNGNVTLVGKCGLVQECPENCVYPDIVMKIRPNNKMRAEFMVLAINSPYITNQVSTLAKTSNGAFKVSGATVRSILMMIPPVDEQVKLIRAVETETLAAINAIARTEREIVLIQEYRTRLTTDIVTGKLDVREAAAKLPEIEDTPEASTNADTLDDELLEEMEPEEEYE